MAELGDVVNRQGDILAQPFPGSVARVLVPVGKVYVTPAQAKAARSFGWKRVRAVRNQAGDLLVIVERKRIMPP